LDNEYFEIDWAEINDGLGVEQAVSKIRHAIAKSDTK
jgi:hypothetical protein